MALDSGVTVLVCSIFFVFLALFRQNVLIFVSHNLDHRPLISPSQKRLFRCFDVDSNGIIDQDEFYTIAKIFHVEDRPEDSEVKLDGTFIKIVLDYNGSPLFPRTQNETVLNAQTFSVFHPRSMNLGYSWTVYKGAQMPAEQHFSSPIRPNYSHYQLYRILSLLHWNAVFNTPSQPPVTAAIVNGVSDTHVRVGFILSAVYQIRVPPSSPLWFNPCHGGHVTSGDGSMVGQVVFNTEDMVLEHIEITCGNGNKALQVRSIGGPYLYEIQDKMLVAVPLGQLEGSEGELSHSWYEELPDWLDILKNTEF